MRLWSIHPRFLDCRGLVALWREGLLAQKVLKGGTKGYRNHPQLDRFKAQRDPLLAIGAYLHLVVDEADARGYRFDRAKIAKGARARGSAWMKVTRGQLKHETIHLRAKLKRRDPERLAELPRSVRSLAPHPLFDVTPGKIEPWERP